MSSSYSARDKAAKLLCILFSLKKSNHSGTQAGLTVFTFIIIINVIQLFFALINVEWKRLSCDFECHQRGKKEIQATRPGPSFFGNESQQSAARFCWSNRAVRFNHSNINFFQFVNWFMIHLSAGLQHSCGCLKIAFQSHWLAFKRDIYFISLQISFRGEEEAEKHRATDEHENAFIMRFLARLLCLYVKLAWATRTNIDHGARYDWISKVHYVLKCESQTKEKPRRARWCDEKRRKLKSIGEEKIKLLGLFIRTHQNGLDGLTHFHLRRTSFLGFTAILRRFLRVFRARLNLKSPKSAIWRGLLSMLDLVIWLLWWEVQCWARHEIIDCFLSLKRKLSS